MKDGQNGMMKWMMTYIWVPADLLDDRLIEMTRVAQEATGDIVCVLDTLEDIGRDGELGALAELGPLALAGLVGVVDPELVVSGLGLRDVLLEDDDVGVGDRLCVYGGDDGSSIAVDGLGAEGRCRRCQGGDGEGDKSGAHDEACPRCQRMGMWMWMSMSMCVPEGLPETLQ